MLSPRLIELIVPGKCRKGHPNAGRSRASSKKCCDIPLSNQNDSFVTTVDGCKQTCDDTKAKDFVDRVPQLKGHDGEHTPVAPDHGGFRNPLGQQHDNGRSSDREMVRACYVLRSKQPVM